MSYANNQTNRSTEIITLHLYIKMVNQENGCLILPSFYHNFVEHFVICNLFIKFHNLNITFEDLKLQVSKLRENIPKILGVARKILCCKQM